MSRPNSFVVVFALGLSCLSPAEARQSTDADMRTRAEAMFGGRLRDVKKEVDDVDVARRRYEAGCYGKVTTTRPIYPQGIPLDRPLSANGALVSGRPSTHSSPATPLRFEILNDTTPVCLILRSDMIAGVASIEHRLDEINEDARRAGIYPGVMRELKTAHGLSPMD